MLQKEVYYGFSLIGGGVCGWGLDNKMYVIYIINIFHKYKNK